MTSFHTKLVAVTYPNDDGTSRQDLIEALEEALEDAQAPIELGARREPNNAFDANAVAICDPDGRQLGYLSRGVAETVAPLLDAGRPVKVTVCQVTGTGLNQFYGVNVQIETE